MTGYEKFHLALIAAAQKIILPVVDKHRDELGESLRNELLGIDGPREVSRIVTTEEKYFGSIFQGFLEISKCIQTLEHLSFLVGRFPFKPHEIPKEVYLQIHIEAYFSEIYILQERLKSYLKLIERKHKGDTRITDVELVCNALEQTILDVLNGVILVRGRHIHVKRFSDDKISRLGSLSMLMKSEDENFSKTMKWLYTTEYKTTKAEWRAQMNESIKGLKNLLNKFFQELHPIIFENKTNELVFPKKVRSQAAP